MGTNLKRTPISIIPIAALPDGLDALAQQARQEGFRFLDRLRWDFNSGANRFSNNGEVLFEARTRGVLVGIGGLNQDPYTSDLNVGRVRRLYVAPDFRRTGVAGLLMAAIEDAALGSFSELRLNTDTVPGAKFYARLGYVALSNDATASHSKLLGCN